MFGHIKNIAKHSVIYGAADMLSRGLSFFMIPLYTHYLSTADYGTLELLDMTSYVIGMFIGLGIGQAVFRYYYDFEEEEKKHMVISVAMITVWVVSIIMLALLFTFSSQISNLVFETSDYFHFFNIVFITLVVGLSNEIPLGFLRIKQKSVIYVIFNLSRVFISLTLNILLVAVFKMGILGILISGVSSSAMLGLALLVYTLRRIKLRYSFSLLKAMLIYSFPLTFTWFGMFILHFGDRFLLQRLTTLSDVGLYTLAYKFGFMPNMLILSPFLLIWAPKRFDLIKEPNAKEIYSVIFTYFNLFQLYASLGIAVLIKDVISIVADADYFSSYQYVPVILMAYVMRGAFVYLEFGVHLKKKTKYLAYATLIGAVLNVGLNFLLIPHIKVWGATLTTFISFAFMLVYIYVVAQKLYYIPFEFWRLIKMTVVALALYGLAELINPANRWVSLGVKFLIGLSFPLVLYLVKFYTEEEIRRIKEFTKMLIVIFKTRKLPKSENEPVNGS